MNEFMKAVENLEVDLNKRIDLLEASIFRETLMIKELHLTLLKLIELQCRREIDKPWELQKNQAS